LQRQLNFELSGLQFNIIFIFEEIAINGIAREASAIHP